MTENKKDLYTLVTERIVADLEKGVRPWQQPWKGGNPSLPLRANGIPYRGINVLLLWTQAVEKGYLSPVWITYDQAKAEGGHVRKGERGTMIVFAKTRTITETNHAGEETERKIPVLKHYTVFNIEQVDDLPANRYPLPPEPCAKPERIERADKFIQATGAIIKHGGASAHYTPSKDRIQMPPLDRFEDKESYYATHLHELIHWTRHKARLNRDFGQKKRGDRGYATEELVAEIGSAFLCAALAITPVIREDHAAYIGDWLTLLENDTRAIFRAAAHAQKATEFLKGLEISALEPVQADVPRANNATPSETGPPRSIAPPLEKNTHQSPTVT